MKNKDKKDFMADVPKYPTTDIEHEYRAGQWGIPATDIELTEEQTKQLDEAISKVVMNTDM